MSLLESSQSQKRLFAPATSREFRQEAQSPGWGETGGREPPLTISSMMPDAIAPDGSEIYFLVGDARRASLVEVRLPAGQTSKAVRHRTVEEIWYFLSGEGCVWRQPPDGPATVEQVAAGTVLTIPTGWAFQFQATAGAELRFLCYTSPPWPGDEEAEPVAGGGLGSAGG